MDIETLAQVKPTRRQINWQSTEFYGFVHFGMNTMTGKEWGTGKESPKLFNPSNVDCDDWIKKMKKAGMEGAILTCKHHDGFSLWPSKWTDYSVKHSPWKNGRGDLVKEFSDACLKYDMKFGIYLSPWDQHEKVYGKGKQYDEFYINQLKELLTQYGKVFSVWLDGANGEGSNGKYQVYDWNRYYKTIREYQPEAVISVCGPDVRWVGNEAGQTRKNEWSVVPKELREAEKVMEESQKHSNEQFSETKLTSSDEDLGSRSIMKDYEGQAIWYPAEVDVSIRPGWFYKQEEDNHVKDADSLFEIYKNSVGNNTTLLLNIPPNKEGEFSSVDSKILNELGKKILSFHKDNILSSVDILFSSNPLNTSKEDLLDKSTMSSYWHNSLNDEIPYLCADFKQSQKINTLVLREPIQLGQRLERTKVYAEIEGKKQLLTEVESVGYQKIIEFPEIETSTIWVEFDSYREYAALHYISLHYR